MGRGQVVSGREATLRNLFSVLLAIKDIQYCQLDMVIWTFKKDHSVCRRGMRIISELVTDYEAEIQVKSYEGLL